MKSATNLKINPTIINPATPKIARSGRIPEGLIENNQVKASTGIANLLVIDQNVLLI